MNIKTYIHKIKHHVNLNNGALALALILALSWLWGTVATLQKNFALQKRVDDYDQRLQIAEIESASLGFLQQYYRSDEYLELSVRQRLNKALPGEHMIILPPPTSAIVEVKDEVEDKPATFEASNFQQWMRFFFGQSSISS